MSVVYENIVECYPVKFNTTDTYMTTEATQTLSQTSIQCHIADWSSFYLLVIDEILHFFL